MDVFFNYIENNEWLLFIIIVILVVGCWLFIIKPFFKWIADFYKKLYQLLKCKIGCHDEVHGMPIGFGEIQKTNVTCKNPKCDWNEERSKFVG
jgi:hypothetical protein